MRAFWLTGILFVAACAPPRAERTYIVSSEPSYYSPVVRLAITVDTTPDSVLVTIDSGTIRAQGMSPSPRVAMRNLTLEAIIARKPAKASGGGELVDPWSALTVSEPTTLVDSLTFGAPVPLRPMRVSIPRPFNADLRRAWLVFRVRGDAMTDEIRLANGTVVQASLRRGGIRVFACSERNLAGTLDRRRAELQRTKYASVC